jgi:hypothetical protein
MGGVSDRGEDVVYPNSPSYPEYGYVPPPASAPAPVPAAPAPAPAPSPNPQQIRDYIANMAQQRQAQQAAVLPIPWGLDPTDARKMIQFQGNYAMNNIPDQGPSPQFSAGYDELMKKAYPS